MLERLFQAELSSELNKDVKSSMLYMCVKGVEHSVFCEVSGHSQKEKMSRIGGIVEKIADCIKENTCQLMCSEKQVVVLVYQAS